MVTFIPYQKQGISIFNIIFEYLRSIQTIQFRKSKTMLKINSTSGNSKPCVNEGKCTIHPKLEIFFFLSPALVISDYPDIYQLSYIKMSTDTEFIPPPLTQSCKQLAGNYHVHSPRKIMMKGINICNPLISLFY